MKSYNYYRHLFQDYAKPFAFVDMDLFARNREDILARAGSKKIRIASKSVRCTFLLRELINSSVTFQGLMCYSPREAVYLSKKGFDDLLVAYPSMDAKDIDDVLRQTSEGKRIYLMTDHEQHLLKIDKQARARGLRQPVCLDLDMSISYPGLHFGVHRSKVNNKKSTKQYLNALAKYPNVALKGLMGYEAQIAGLGDKASFGVKNSVIRRLKKRAIPEIAKRREQTVEMIRAAGHKLDFVNGGGTGSMETTRTEQYVTEIAVGSGFYSPTLFDYYDNFKHQPACAFAIEIVRKPNRNTYTCAGGGFPASGSPGIDKAPAIYLPRGAKLTDNEGAGEVQTPVLYKGPQELSLGDPIFLRHAKAGELCERFNELHLVSKGKVIKTVPTYRGEGQCFL